MFIAAETWHELLRDWNHWVFEIISGGISAAVAAWILRPVFREAIRRHDARVHKHVHCDDAHGVNQNRDSVGTEYRKTGNNQFDKEFS